MSAPLVRLSGALGAFVYRQLGIKAAPPAYNRTVATIRGLLAQQWGIDFTPIASSTIEALADLVETEGNARKRAAKARRILEGAAAELAAKGQAIPPDRLEKIGRSLAGAYKLGMAEVGAELGWSIDFQLPDLDAIAGLHDSGIYWVGQFYGNHLTDDALLRAVQSVMLEQGLGREEGGRQLRAIFEPYVGSRPDAYWEGLAQTVATRARSFGALSALVETGAVTYEYINPDDERTSEVCRRLNGTIFTVKGAVELRERFVRAGSPEQVKAIAPWPKPAQLERANGSLLSPAELQRLGIAWPPLHFFCRSSIEVASWGPMPDVGDDLGDIDVGQRVRRA